MDNQFDMWLRMRAAQKQNIAYAVVDENLVVVAHNAAMNDWVEQDGSETIEGAGKELADLVGRYLPDVFYELVGVEDLLRHMVRNRDGTFTIPQVQRASSDGLGRYFDLQVEPMFEFGATLLVLAIDVTEQARMEQRLRQQNNDLRLLHVRFREANDRLTYLLHHFVPQEVAQRLTDTRQPPQPGGQQRDATVMFADARDFTALAESLKPAEILEVLNAHFSVISEAIQRHQGTLLEYVGDMAMSVFNVPDDQPDHPLRAARAALDMRDSLEQFAAQCRAASLPVLRFGIGLSAGDVIAGYQGTEYYYKYAALGDTTNVAYHICTKAKGGQILISHNILERLDGQVRVTPLGNVQLKRRREPLPIYELLGLAE